MLKLTIAIAAAAILFAGHAWAQTPAEIEAICATTACRSGGFDVVVRVDAERYQAVSVVHSPYVLEDGSILIFPGETLAFHVPVVDGKAGKPEFYRAFAPHLPAEIAADDKTLTNPADATLPVLPELKSGPDLSSLPPDTFLISYGQLGEQPDMFLMLYSKLDHPLKFNATMAIIQSDGYDFRSTSTCPLMPNLGLYENWPHPIGPMILENLHFLPDDDTRMVCN